MQWSDFNIEQKDRLIRLYATGKENRFYHSLIHASLVADTVRFLNQTVGFEHYLECSLAAWFHDCIYIPGAIDNEKQSALEAEKFINDFGIQADAKYVSYLIELTLNHNKATCEDEALFLDADLEILASPEFRFKIYEKQLWKEYSSIVDFDTFCIGRYNFLSNLLKQNTIFHSEYGREKWENKARMNIASSIRVLSRVIEIKNLA